MPQINWYYRSPSLVALILVPFGMALVTACQLKPSMVPYELLGPIGTLAKLLVTDYPVVLSSIFYFAWIAHVGEGAFAANYALKNGLSGGCSFLWGIQTFLYGYFSLSLLLKFESKKNT